MTPVLIGLGWALAVVAFLTVAVGLCKAAAAGDDIARRTLGPASSSSDRAMVNCEQSGSDDFAFGVLIAMDDHRAPHERRHA